MPIVVGKRAGTPDGGVVVIDITGGVSRHIVCEVQAGRASLVAAPSAAPLATITLDVEAFVVLATGRRSASAVPTTIVGDQELGNKILSAFNMMI